MMKNPPGMGKLMARLQTLRGLIEAEAQGTQPAETISAAKAELAKRRKALMQLLAMCTSLTRLRP
jgi:hypothetical protein